MGYWENIVTNAYQSATGVAVAVEDINSVMVDAAKHPVMCREIVGRTGLDEFTVRVCFCGFQLCDQNLGELAYELALSDG